MDSNDRKKLHTELKGIFGAVKDVLNSLEREGLKNKTLNNILEKANVSRDDYYRTLFISFRALL